MMKFRFNREVVASQKKEIVEFLRSMPEERHISGLLFNRFTQDNCVCVQGAILLQQGFVFKRLNPIGLTLVHEESGREYDPGDTVSLMDMPGIPVSALLRLDEDWGNDLQKESERLIERANQIKKECEKEGRKYHPSLRNSQGFSDISFEVAGKLAACILRVAGAEGTERNPIVSQVKIHSEAVISPTNFHHQVSNMEVPLSSINDSLGLKLEHFANLIEKTW